ncbi:hypothetical protein SAMN05444673_4080 [Bacillus sp. OV166]|nr:hypothetical protein SAMN05444673_4080 [Bacillus sp. OV166]
MITKILYHLLLLSSIGFAFFLYSDDYTIFPWAKQDEALKFLHLIITIPIPLISALIINNFINRNGSLLHTFLLKYYPIICLILISGYCFIINSLNSLLLKIGFGITIFLLFLEIYLFYYDIKKEFKKKLIFN